MTTQNSKFLEKVLIRYPQFKNQKQNIIDSFETYDESNQTLENLVSIISMLVGIGENIVKMDEITFDIKGVNGDFVSQYAHKINTIDYCLGFWAKHPLLCQAGVKLLNFEKKLLSVSFDKYTAYKKCLANIKDFNSEPIAEYMIFFSFLSIISHENNLNQKISYLEFFENNLNWLCELYMNGENFYEDILDYFHRKPL
jgi:hypothetical protein